MFYKLDSNIAIIIIIKPSIEIRESRKYLGRRGITKFLREKIHLKS